MNPISWQFVCKLTKWKFLLKQKTENSKQIEAKHESYTQVILENYYKNFSNHLQPGLNSPEELICFKTKTLKKHLYCPNKQDPRRNRKCLIRSLL